MSRKRSHGWSGIVVGVGPVTTSGGTVGNALSDPWLWGPAAASLLAPLAAIWRPWAGWVVWCVALVAACAGFLLVAAGTALLGIFATLFGYSPDWSAAVASFGAPGAMSTTVLAGSWLLTRRVGRTADAVASRQVGDAGGPDTASH